MLAEKTKSKLLIGLIVLVVALTVVLIALHALRGRDKRAALPPVTPRPSAEVVIREKEVEKIITVEKEITADTVQESLRDAGMTEAEAEDWYCSLVFSSDLAPQRPAMRIEVLDGPRLHGIDLILGWPEGEARVVKEEQQGDIQILETIIEVPMKDGGTEKTLFLFRFDTKRQVLLSIAGAEELLDFPTLEAIAEHIELRETGFVYSLDHSGQNWSVHALAYG